ncbi:MAG: hypothetical protein AB8G11_15555 [Saprospiraceae bacterium]
MKCFFSIMIILLSINPLLAQEEEMVTELKQAVFNDFVATSAGSSGMLSSATYAATESDQYLAEGSIFLNDEFLDVEVFGNKGEVFKSKGKYNIQADELQYFDTQKNIKAIKADKIQGFAINNKIFVSKMEADSSYAFYEILAHGNIQLLIKHKIILTEINNNPVLGTTSAAGSTTGKIKATASEKIYYATDITLDKLPKSKKKLLKLMGDYESDIAKTIKEKDLNIKAKKDLIAIFRLYNELSNQ